MEWCENRVTPLHWAAAEDHEAVCRYLVDAGADVGAADVFGQTPLHWAAHWGHEAVSATWSILQPRRYSCSGCCAAAATAAVVSHKPAFRFSSSDFHIQYFLNNFHDFCQ